MLIPRHNRQENRYGQSVAPNIKKIRLLILDYGSSYNSDEDVVDKKYVDGKTFTSDA